jgi:cobalt-precorrin-5B (C1)-methyltransferase
VSITLPKGETPSFPLALRELEGNCARAGIIKDAGDDPDVTHGALIIAALRRHDRGSRVIFKAGEGVGTVTKPGLPLAVGEPAINPVPRRLMTEQIESLASEFGDAGNIEIEIHVPGGEEIAQKTWNPRLGILGGISILGTTGIVLPYSCSAWIHSIHRGIDVARATGLEHVAGCTGSTSESAVQSHYGLSDTAMLDMGDFAGGLLKYLRKNPIPRLTIGGGFAKLTKLAQGHLDLHSGRSQVDFGWMAKELAGLGTPDEICQKTAGANSANEVLEIAVSENIPLPRRIANRARDTAVDALEDSSVEVEVLIFDRRGALVGQSDFGGFSS